MAHAALRLSFLAASSLLVAAPLAAADLDGSFLRGDVSQADGSIWDGAYIGASVGYTSLRGTAGGRSDNDVRDDLRGTATLSELNPDELVTGVDGRDEELSYGGAAGYNWSSQGVVFGIEGAYQRTDLTIAGDDTTRHLYAEAGDVGGQTVFRNFQARYGGAINITDIATLKGRIGYDMGMFLPFATLGVAAVRGSTEHYTAIGAGDTFGAPGVNVPNTPQYSSNTENVFGFGFVGGAGLDVMLAEGFFLRGEWEIMRIGSFDGEMQDLQTFKSMLAAKF
jgi:outer membrane immunogenic protein